MDGLSFDIDADMASVFVYLLGSDWKMRWELVVGLWKKLVQSLNWNRCRVSSAARNFDKMPTQTKVIIFFFEQRSLQLSIYLGRLNSEGGTSCFVKLYCGKRFLKTFFTDLINGQKQIRGTHVTRAVLSCWRLRY